MLRNRSVLAALTNKQSREDGTLTQDEIKWLERRAKDGFGIVTTAAAFIHPSGKSWIGELGVHSDDMLPGLENLSERIRLHGAVSLVQIFHGGMRAPTDLTGEVPISSSVIRPNNPQQAIRVLWKSKRLKKQYNGLQMLQKDAQMQVSTASRYTARTDI